MVRSLSIRKKLLLLCGSPPLLTAATVAVCAGTYGTGTCLTAGLLALALTCGLSLACMGLLLQRLERSFRSVAETAQALGQGHFERRATFAPEPELDQLGRVLNDMAEQVSRSVQAAVTREEEIRAVLNAMREGVLVLDCQCRIRSFNRSMETILPGIGERIGASPLELLPSPELIDACQAMLRHPHQEQRNLTVAHEDRHVYDVNLIRASKAAGQGVVAVFRDVSEIKRLESVRRDFAANVSHELRTPLTSIKGYAETLLGDTAPPPEMTGKFLRVILRNADHMSKMITDLLSLARLESQGNGLIGREKGTPMDPRASLRMAWESVQEMAGSRYVALLDEMPEVCPRVLADKEQLAQIFRNLVENAIKFGPEARPIKVGLRVLDGMAEFTVRDFGPGIPLKDQPRVFERFYSVEKHRRNEFGSTGLGLAITRHLVHNLGGTIRLESPPKGYHEGTAFLFTLPLA
ncbi:MAG: ATP-binding protein [Desulfovibrionaceae bacterium]